MDHPLRRALAAKGISQREAAAQLQVDPKTVQRWCAGRLPYPRHRALLSVLTGWPVHDLWPNGVPISERQHWASEASSVDSRWRHMSSGDWCDIFGRAQRYIDILTISLHFVTGNDELLQLLQSRARAGVRVRVLASDADGGVIPPPGRASPNSLVKFRIHNVTHYNNIYRMDDELLIQSNAYGVPISSLPIFRRAPLTETGLAGMYLDSFEAVWARSVAVEEIEHRSE